MAYAAAWLLSCTLSGQAAQRQTIKHPLPPNARAHPVGRLNEATRLSLTIALPLQNTSKRRSSDMLPGSAVALCMAGWLATSASAAPPPLSADHSRVDIGSTYGSGSFGRN